MPIRLVPKNQSNKVETPSIKSAMSGSDQTAPLPEIEQGIEERIVATLAEITGPEGYVPASKVAQITGFSLLETIKSLSKLATEKRILRYGDNIDLWAASLKVQREFGFVKQFGDPGKSVGKEQRGEVNS